MREVAADRIQLEFVKSNGCAGICGQAETIRIESARSVVAVHSPLPHPVLSQRVYSWLASHETSIDHSCSQNGTFLIQNLHLTGMDRWRAVRAAECPPTMPRPLGSLGNHH